MNLENIEDIYELSPLQEGMLFHALYEPGTGVYIEQLSCELGGALDAERFRSAWQAILDRHTALRSAFSWEDLDKPLQIVHRGIEVPFEQLDWRDLPAREQETRLEAFIADSALEDFRLDQAPLMRLSLIRLAEDRHHFVWCFHHLLMDGWCMPIVMRELFHCYDALARDPGFRLPAARPYGDYIGWLQAQDIEQARRFWRARLGDVSAPTSIANRAYPLANGDGGYPIHQAIVSQPMTAALQKFARSHQLTLQNVVQGALAIALARHSARQEVLFGTTVSGRPPELPGAEEIVGLFINTLPVHLEVSPQASLVPWLKAVQDQQNEMQQYEYTPLVEIRKCSGIPADSPLFEVHFVFENFPVGPALEGPAADIRIQRARSQSRTSFPLSISAVSRDQIVLRFHYHSARHAEAEMQALGEHVVNLLRAFLQSPDARLGDLPMLAAAETRQLLETWNATERAYADADRPLHALIVDQARRTPSHPAVVAEDGTLSYAELDAQTDRLAARLRALGVGDDQVVGVCAERSREMVVALVAILKAGAAYLPLDPTLPQARLAYMAENSRAPLILAQSRFADLFAGSDVAVEPLLAQWPEVETSSLPAVSPLQAAYVIYTSGTTGLPKGVAVPHRGIVNRLLWMQEAYAIGPEDRVLQKTPYTFDVSVWEFFWPLLTGATLVMARPEGHRDPQYLAELIARERITTLHFVPSMLSAFLQANPEQVDEARPEAAMRSLRQVMCSGEALGTEQVSRFHAGYTAALHNLYGPTEASVDVSYWACEPGHGRPSVPIGYPIANTQLYVLDAGMGPVPVGVPGELYIGGTGLARGYLGRPALTAERFVPDPYATVPGERLYRTGDLARFAADGSIEFLGRLDHQVKLRGFRIELGEIEAVLLQQPGVRDALVLLREDVPGDARLVGYVVGDAAALAPEAVLAALAARLPEYMLPAALVVLEAFPLTANGKLDRKALPAPALRRAERVAPATPTEELLAAVFARLLGLEAVWRDDHFFQLGGHSLLATQLVSRIREAFAVELPLRAVFEAPTLAALAAKIDAGQRGAEETIAPVDRSGPLPLSYAQERLWFLDRLDPGKATYNVPVGLRLEGPLDEAALGAAIAGVIARHEILRSRIRAGDAGPQLVVEDWPDWRWEVETLDGPAGEREARARQIAQAEAVQPFDLAHGPLVRVRLVRLGAEDALLLLTFHHIVSDGWSLNVLLAEVSQLYADAQAGRAPSLPALPIQYVDYAAWQRAYLGAGAEARQLAYWKTQLAEAPTMLALPLDRPRPPVQAFRGGVRGVQLPLETLRALEALARERGATLYMLLLAAFQALLARYTGQEDILVGSPIAGRAVRATEPLIGFFVNTLVLRARPRPGQSFAAFLAQVRETALEAYAHQDVPFERLVEEIQPERSLSHTPLFQVMFALQAASELPGAATTALGADDGDGLRLRPVGVESAIAKFDQSWTALVDGEGLRLAVEYDRDLFEGATVERMLAHYVRVLAQVVADPQVALGRLSLLDEAARTQVLEEWNATERAYADADRPLHALIVDQARRTPSHPAVVAEDGTLSYAELDAQTDRLAARLRALGVGDDQVVGVCAERSREMVVALVAILKAGAAYLPLDPTLPQARLAYMAENSRAPLILAQSRFADLFAGSDVAVEPLLAQWPEVETSSLPAVSPLQAAYVIYTSGTTGLPKGVAVPHRGIVNRLLWMQEAYAIGPEDRVLQKTPYTFDVSVWEFFWPLLTGATLVMARPEGHRDPQYLAELIARERITTLHFVPSMLSAFLQANPEQVDEARPEAAMRSLRQVMCSGEALGTEQVSRFHAGYTAALHNLYGPTEASVDVSYWACEPGHGRPSVPIGYPIANTQLYVLDAGMGPVPVGVPGELYIGGTGLARGYLGRPALTAERFVPDPYATAPGERLYRTGDLARFAADGSIEFLGRLDHQVKLRGFRIELGEIEAVLLQQPGVRDALVLLREDVPGDARLVGYVVGDAAALAPETVLAALAARLPEYMLPAALVVLEAFPLTANGKLDRKALPAPALRRAERVAPATPTEELLAAVFARLLGLEAVWRDDHFFQLGGHSLLATQLVSRIREAFAVELPLRAVFEAPTLAALAAKIDAGQRGAEETIAPVDRSGPLPLSYAQERLWFLDRLDPGKATYNVPVGLRLEGPLDEAALGAAIAGVIARHEILRSRIRAGDAGPQLVVEDWPDWRWEVETLDGPAGEREARARQIAQAEAMRPFDLAHGPLVRVRLVRLGAEDALLLLTFHHIVSDGWSLNVLLAEVSQLYADAQAGRAPSLPALPIQYVDYAAWQRAYLGAGAEARQLAYWKAQLAEAPTMLALPLDRPRPPVQAFRGGVRGVQLPLETLRALEALARERGATLYMLLLAAFQALLARYTGQEDILVGSPIAGRAVRATEPLIGFFVNTLVLRARPRPGQSFAAFLAQVRETALEAYAHQDVPFERLVEEIQPERSLSHTPLFQVMFALQAASELPGAATTALGADDGDGLRLRPVGVESAIAKFDQSWTALVDGEGLRLAVEYDRDLFEGATVERMLAHYVRVLAQVVADPQVALGRLSLLDEAARTQVLEEWNATAQPLPEASVVARFAAQVRARPEAVALVEDGRSLTYAELDAASNRLAQVLRARGIGAEQRVAVCLDRSIELVVAVLGILKTGAAYVPLESAYPAERLAFLLEDAAVTLVVTCDALSSRLPPSSVPQFNLDRAHAELAVASADAPAVTIDPEQLCYVMYTSGSTGTPKGVAVPHRGVLRLVLGADYAFFGPEEVFLQFAPVAFDASCFELWGALLHGGRVAIFPPHLPSLGELQGFIERHGVTTAWLTAGLFHAMAAERPEAFAGLRQLLAGGDVLTPALVAQVQRAHPELRLINGYGPTESTTFTACHTVREEDLDGHHVSIGRPIANTRVYLLDAGMGPVPVGVPGELYIGGTGLARGYLGRPALTAERFVPDPYATAPGERLYRTGDLARFAADGSIEFLGRLDHQVKLRGFRIELGEIEAVLLQQPGVRDALVLLREDVPGDARLVGYVVGDAAALAPEAVLAALAARLPEYMLPAALVVLEAFPLTANGKLDRKALPAPALRRAERVAPATPTEELLAAVFARLLGLEAVWRDDHFFQLGGHSLLATQLVSRIREAFAVELPLRAVFEAPTLAALAAKIDAGQRGAEETIAPVDRSGPLPLSYAQERLWFLDRLDPGKATYNVPVGLRLEGPLDEAALGAAIAGVIARHEILRSRIRAGDAGPQLVVEDWPDWRWEVETLDGPAGEREARARQIAQAEAVQPFDLAHGPLVRVRLVRLGAEDALLLLTFHHIVSDGWSLNVLLAEVSQLYADAQAGRAPSLPALPIQYVDYAAWQRAYLGAGAEARQLAYWKTQLAEAPTMLALPLDRPRPPVQAFRGGVRGVQLPLETLRALEALARERGATLYMLLLAAFQALLARYTGQEDILVGSPIAGRAVRATEPLIGFFVNTLVLRARPRPGQSFAAFLAQVRETALEAYAHQDVPFERLVEEIQPERSLSHTPLFQVMFALQAASELPGAATTALGADDGDGLRLRPVGVESAIAKFDQSWTALVDGEGLRLAVEYDRDLFEGATVERMLAHYVRVLAQVVADPQVALGRLSLLDEAARTQVLEEWNATAQPLPEASVVARFAAQVRARPEAVALVEDGRSLTYAELDAASNRLAQVLRARGIGAEQRVAVCLDRSIELVVAVLGILKTGAAYVPLESAYPAERLAFLLEDAAVTLVVTCDALSSRLPPSSVPQFNLDRAHAELAVASADAPAVTIDPEQLCYVMYTSGSTGTPKGVAVPHRGVLRLVLGADYAFFGPEEVFLQFAPVAFDASCFELWGALLHGGRVAIFPPHLPSLGELQGFIERHGVTTAWLTAGLFHAMAAERPEAFAGLRQLLAGGDVLTPALVAQVQRAHPELRLINGYGPTESTTFTACHTVREEDLDGHHVPIGRPIANTRVYLLDAGMGPVPVGVPGELYIGGTGLARGYLGRPALTAERFVPDPYATVPGERLYRTGDLARFAADGSIEFLGRLDHQVKLRGFRIELGEIEAVLLQQPGVRDALVLLREDVPGDARLVGYVVGDAAALAPETVLAALAARLPEYMLPAALVVLEAFPLTANGKLDRKALPAPALRRAERVAPATPTEELLAAVFARLLGLEAVWRDDHFFQLGGHSLLATQLVSRIREAFAVELPLRAVFEAPTLAALAAKIDAGQRGAEETIAPVDRSGPLPLSYAQERLWFLDRLDPGKATYNVPVGLRLEGPLDEAALGAAIAGVIARHEILRSRIRAGDAGPQLVVEDWPDWRWEVETLDGPAGEREARARQIAQAEAMRPFDLAHGPLVRVRLVRLGAEDALLLLTFHHIVSDGWSLNVLLAEVSQLYADAQAGRAPSLPALPIQYVDYAAWQRAYLGAGAEARQLAYWKAQLAEAPTMLALPLDRPRPPVQAFRGGVRGVQLPLETLRALEALARERGATLYMLLLAAFQALLARYTGQEDILVGSPIAGRAVRATEPLIGFFVNTLVLRARPRPGQSFAAFLAQVRETALEAYAHQDVPFERLVEEIQPERSLSHTPLFQVMFALQAASELPGAATTALGADDGDGLRLRPVGVESAIAKFDQSWTALVDGEGLRLAVEYDRDLFEGATVERMLAHYVRVLAQVVADPQVALGRLSLLDEAARAQVLEEWNATAQPLPEASVVARFAAQVRARPEAVALVEDGRSLTYAELDAASNRLAQVLRARGIGAEQRVAVALPRSAAQVQALLAVMKTGAAYVPLEPSLPAQRQAFIADDARVSLWVAENASAPAPASVPTLDWASWTEAAAEASADAPAATIDPAQLAYVIYTSGSTGTPKGVAVPQRGLCNLLGWHQHRYGLGPQDRCTLLAGLGFDASAWELWPALTAGAQVHPVPEAARMDPARLHGFLVERGITQAFVPTVLVEPLLDRDWSGSALRVLLTGGDALQVRPPQGLPFALVNHYGPTESSVVTTAGEVRPGSGTPSIGRPIANTRVYLLDAGMGPVPVGVPGELYIGGTGLARGYLGRPALTAERFVPDPYATVPGERLYRTGDLARFAADGSIEFLGRLDHQVKLRGFRIELGEIEAVLLQQPGVRDALVLLREDVPGDARLVGYVVGDAAALAPEAVLAALAARLPEYMLPAALVVLEAFPLTANGKLDRKALPAPALRRAERVAPATPTEELLAAVFARLLGLEAVWRDDHFFQLGGHSLLATQLVSRIREAFAVELPLRAVFEAPTLAALAAKIDAGQRGAEETIAPVDRSGPLPLSYAQERLWFLDRLDPGKATYNVPVGLRLEGPLDEAALGAAIAGVIARHEILRSRIRAGDAGPQLVVEDWPDWRWEVETLDGPAEEREARARQIAQAEAMRPFDLAHGPLVRVRLVRLGAEDALLLLTFHHIVSDGWSLNVLLAEVSQLYADAQAGRAPSLPALPIQYVDYAAWQRAYLGAGAEARQLAYWKAQLAEAPTMLALPLDRPRPPVQAFRGGVRGVQLPLETLRALEALARERGATLYMLLLAAFQALLARYTGQEDILVGSPIAGRAVRATEPLIGFFVNTLVLRARPRPGQSFAAFLAQVRETALEAYAHQDVPFERLVEEIQPERSLSHTPLFQVMFALQAASELPGAATTALGADDGDGLRLRPVGVESAIAKFDQSWTALVDGEGLRLAVEYDRDLFEGATVERMLAHYVRVLAQVVADPQVALGRLSLLDEAARTQVLEEWNATAQPLPEASVVARFAAQVRARPEAVALVEDGRSLTYAELDTASNRLAQVLRARGIGAEQRVAVALPRSAAQVQALLAVMKTGAAYVPLEPSLPAQRQAFIADDARVSLWVAENASAPAPASVPTLDWASWTAAEAEASADAPAATIDPAQLAYVIYTSGSTGTPKGVAVPQRGLCNLLGWHQHRYGLGPQDRCTLLAGLGFDASAWELWPALTAGAQVHPVPEAARMDPARLHGFLVERGITQAFVPTVLVEPLLGRDWSGSALRVLLTGGDALQVRPPQGLPFALVNHYGPTESSVVTTAGEVRPGSGTPSIGRPIANTRVYLLDAGMGPVPVGVPGELYIGGTGLARGYLGRPALTAERFVPDPYATVPGERLYRTGDLARFAADGSIEFLGRLDHQVKLRGFRIELGEIEAVLLQQPGVRDALVLLREDVPGDARLVGYVVGDAAALAPEAVLAALAARLPEYMLPAALVVLEAFPLTANGKLDRKALPAPALHRTAKHGAVVYGATEIAVIRAMEDVLGTQQVGLHDDFFRIGGHSMLAIRLLAALEQRFGDALTLADLFRHTTPAEIARLLDAAGDGRGAGTLVPLRAGDQGRPLFVVHPGGGTVFGYLALVRHLPTELAVYGLQSRAVDSDDAESRSITQMATEYIAEIRSVQPRGPYRLAGWSMGGAIAYEMAFQLRRDGDEVEWVALIDSVVPALSDGAIEPVRAADLLRGFAREIGFAGEIDWDSVAHDETEAVASLARAAEAAGLLRADRDLRRLRRLYRAYRDNASALLDYAPGGGAVPLLLFVAGEHLLRGFDRGYGWRKLVGDALLETHVLPADHFGIVREPVVASIATTLRARLAHADGGRARTDAALAEGQA